MEETFIIIDSNKREQFTYEDPSFPFGICEDKYSLFPEKTLPIHWHDSFELDFVQSGSIEFMIDDTAFELVSGEAAFVNMNTLHSARQVSEDNASVAVVVFQPQLFPGGTNGILYQKNIKQIIESGIQGFKVGASSESGKQILDILTFFSTIDKGLPGYELVIMEKISRLWFLLQQYFYGTQSFIRSDKFALFRAEEMKQMLIYIQEHYAEKISIKELAKNANISRTECFIRFRQYMNTTPNGYITDYRLLQSEKMLQTTNNNIADIATYCGFSSQSYFCKLFKQKYSHTPLAYRNISQQEF